MYAMGYSRAASTNTTPATGTAGGVAREEKVGLIGVEFEICGTHPN
jgi:hypothetical protein